jgi:hypothetical protein
MMHSPNAHQSGHRKPASPYGALATPATACVALYDPILVPTWYAQPTFPSKNKNKPTKDSPDVETMAELGRYPSGLNLRTNQGRLPTLHSALSTSASLKCALSTISFRLLMKGFHIPGELPKVIAFSYRESAQSHRKSPCRASRYSLQNI